jgi:membrane protease YdiL (CAAX protease family)
MNNVPQEVGNPLVTLGVLLIFAACVAIWAQIVYRLIRGLPILPYTPRRMVPWKLIDVVGVLLGYMLLAFWFTFLVQFGFGVRFREAPADHREAAVVEKPAADQPQADEPKPDLAHPLIVLLRSRPNPVILLFCVLIAAVVAPVAEEIMFRLLLQGWLEAFERRHRRRWAVWRRLARGIVPVVLVSALFAAAHFREQGREPDPDALLYLFAIDAAAKLLAIGIGLGLIYRLRGATLADLGLVPATFWSDVRLGLLSYLACAPVVLAIQAVAINLLPKWLAADPIALFVFASVLGTLYYRTHRIVPSIVTHMALNTMSLAAAWTLA